MEETLSATTVRATLDQKLIETMAHFQYYSDQIAQFEHSQGMNDNIALCSLTTTNFETLFLSALVNSSLLTNTTHLTLSSHSLYDAYKTFYGPFFCTNYVDCQPHNIHKTPMVYHVPDSISRVNAILKKLIIKPQPLQYHTVFGRDIRGWFKPLSLSKDTNKAEPPQIIRNHKIVRVCIQTLKSRLLKRKCYDKHVRLSQPLLSRTPTLAIEKPKFNKRLPKKSTTTQRIILAVSTPSSNDYYDNTNGASIFSASTISF